MNMEFETNCPDGQLCGARNTTGCTVGKCQRKGTTTCKHFLNLQAGESVHILTYSCPYCEVESLSAQVAELRRALEWIADQERYTFAECSLAEQIISTAKNVIACKKEEK